MKKLLALVTVATCTATVVGFLSRSWWFFELFSHFRVQYFFILLACGVIYLGSGRFRRGVIALAFSIINFTIVGNYQVETPVQASIQSRHGRTLRAVFVNVQYNNRAHAKLEPFIRSTDADLILLQEINEAWIASLKPLFKDYPYNKFRAAGNHGGIALLSRIPFEHAAIRIMGEVGLPTITARFGFHGEQFTLVGTHTYSPASRRRAANRNRQLIEVGKFISDQEDAVLLLGDLNITPWSPIFKDFLRSTGLRDSREGFGLQPTWPTWFPPAWIPIDHGLVSLGLTVHDRWVGPYIGSDHYPVVIDFSITAKR